MKTKPRTIVLVHGLWVTPLSWEAGTLGVAVLQNLLASRDAQLALLYASVTVALVFTGPGQFSLDRRARPRTGALKP